MDNDGKEGSAPGTKKLGLTHLFGIWPGFLAVLHCGPGDGKAGHTSSLQMMLKVGLALSALLVRFDAFLETLRWPSSVDDVGLGGASFLC